MTDPLSISAGAVGLLTFGIQTISVLVEYYSAYKNVDKNITHTTERLESLNGSLQFLEKTLRTRSREGTLGDQVETSIQSCHELIEELVAEYQKFKQAPASTAHGVGRRLAYPFRKSTLEKLDENITEIRANISFAINALNLQSTQTTQDDVSDVRVLVERMRATQISDEIAEWLKPPDAYVDHYAACAKRHPGTGAWFTSSKAFHEWLDQGPMLWLYGFAGCGKTVLLSTVILQTFRMRGNAQNTGVAFFYFTFSDESKRHEQGMLRGLLSQLAGQSPNGTALLSRLHSSCKPHVPSAEAMRSTLRTILESFDQVYVLLDALDECPEYERCRILETLGGVQSDKTRLLITSRDLIDIRQDPTIYASRRVHLHNDQIDQDINEYISGCLERDVRLRKWHPFHERIQTELSTRALGVFRWVDCQLEALKRCPRSEGHLEECLRSLPQGLDETYERMLCGISEFSVSLVRRALMLLCFAFRPLTIAELIDGMAVDLKTGLDHRNRLLDEDSLFELCPGMLDLVDSYEFDDDIDDPLSHRVRIAHFSVQEYLESTRIHEQRAVPFALNRELAYFELCQVCCLYLLDAGSRGSDVSDAVIRGLPLARYAAYYWYDYYKKASSQDVIQALIVRLFRHTNTFRIIALADSIDEEDEYDVGLREDRAVFPSPVYYASLLGLDVVLKTLLKEGESSILVNELSGRYGCPLQAAARHGRVGISKILLEAGAVIDLRGGCFGAPLHAAAASHPSIVQFLLEAGADIDFRGRAGESALMQAVDSQNEDTVEHLLDAGAKVDLQTSNGRTALMKAARLGHARLVKRLINAGASVDITNRWGESAVLVAVYIDYEDPKGYQDYVTSVQHLIDARAFLDFKNSDDNTAICIAAEDGKTDIVRILANAGANVDIPGEVGRTPLFVASSHGEEEIVQYILDAGAKIDTCDDFGVTALVEAIRKNHESIALKLIDAGADGNICAPEGSPIQFAVKAGLERVFDRLLAKTVDVRAQTKYGVHRCALEEAVARKSWSMMEKLFAAGATVDDCDGSALRAAVLNQDEGSVWQLMDMGADINAGKGFVTSALQIACIRGRIEFIQKFLSAGAEDWPGGFFGDTLQAAIVGGNDVIISLILESGFKSHQGGIFGGSLQAAAFMGSSSVVQRLLDAGLDVHNTGISGNALLAAAGLGHTDVVRQLLKAGADVDAHGPLTGTALMAAVIGGNPAMVKMLLDAKANVNKRSQLTGHLFQYGVDWHALRKLDGFLQLNATSWPLESRVEKVEKMWRGVKDQDHQEELKIALLETHGQTAARFAELREALSTRQKLQGTPLEAAAWHGHGELVTILIEAGADVNARDESFGTALHAAATTSSGIVELLLEAGADVNAHCGGLGTPLHAACRTGTTDTLETLLKAGADVHVQTERDGTALHIASLYKNVPKMRVLVEAGAPINVQGGKHGTPLDASLFFHSEEPVIRLLLDAGAGLKDPDAGICEALKQGNKDKAIQLLQNRASESFSKWFLNDR